MDIDIRTVLLGIVVSPILQAILQISGIFVLTPMANWGWDSNTTIVTYLATITSAAFACLLPARRNMRKRLLLAVGLTVFVTMFIAYQKMTNTPPPASYVWLYDSAALFTFFGTYIGYGFSVGRITTFYVPAKEANTRTRRNKTK